ncbi:MAG: hypothetical protein E7022_08205 [Desulfovibrio desulfuricans]|nr:hypothetical protein [Desulfovibrio desulfuricans]
MEWVSLAVFIGIIFFLIKRRSNKKSLSEAISPIVTAHADSTKKPESQKTHLPRKHLCSDDKNISILTKLMKKSATSNSGRPFGNLMDSCPCRRLMRTFSSMPLKNVSMALPMGKSRRQRWPFTMNYGKRAQPLPQ